MTIRQFLRSRRQDQSAIGDLARDALIDPEWKGQRSAESLREMLETCGASSGAREALRRAEAEYTAAEGRPATA